MSVDWGRFLSALERQVRAHPVTFGQAGGPVWHAPPSASDGDIAALGVRFAAQFPPSYVGFLRASNGLAMASHPVSRILPAGEVRWFRRDNRDWIRAYAVADTAYSDAGLPDDEYYAYTEEARQHFRPKHLAHAVQISDVGDATAYLLNPQVVDAAGEWEAWVISNSQPGVTRYRSFAELMFAEYANAADGLGPPNTTSSGENALPLPTVYVDAPGKPGRKTKKLRIPRPPRPFERIARDVREGDLPTLQTAIKELARLRTPEAMELLGEVLRTHPAHLVREDVAHALSSARRTDAVPLLIDALGDEYYGSAGAAASALARIGDVRAVEHILRLLQKRGAFTLHVAASALAKFKEPRAAEMIGEILKTSDARENHNADSLGGVLLDFGDTGLRVLLDVMDSGNPKAKLRALRAAVYFPMAQVERAIRRLTADADEAVRNEAARALDLLPQLEGVKRR